MRNWRDARGFVVGTKTGDTRDVHQFPFVGKLGMFRLSPVSYARSKAPPPGRRSFAKNAQDFGWRVAQVSHSRVVFRWHRPAEGAPCLVLFETWVPRPPIPGALRGRSSHLQLQNVPFVDPLGPPLIAFVAMSGMPRAFPSCNLSPDFFITNLPCPHHRPPARRARQSSLTCGKAEARPSPETGIPAHKKVIRKRSLTTQRSHGKYAKWPEMSKVRR